jgi:hypothetical protein
VLFQEFMNYLSNCQKKLQRLLRERVNAYNGKIFMSWRLSPSNHPDHQLSVVQLHQLKPLGSEGVRISSLICYVFSSRCKQSRGVAAASSSAMRTSQSDQEAGSKAEAPYRWEEAKSLLKFYKVRG